MDMFRIRKKCDYFISAPAPPKKPAPKKIKVDEDIPGFAEAGCLHKRSTVAGKDFLSGNFLPFAAPVEPLQNSVFNKSSWSVNYLWNIEPLKVRNDININF